MIARDVTNSFDAMRSYLRQARKVIDHVDPHLCSNVGLVQRLVNWEETWEVGRKYVGWRPMLHAVGDVLVEFRKVQQVTPTLQENPL